MEAHPEIKIDSNIPVPSPLTGRKSIYPWKDLEVGQSFLCRNSAAHQSASTASKKNSPKKFIARKTPEGMRIWRIE